MNTKNQQHRSESPNKEVTHPTIQLRAQCLANELTTSAKQQSFTADSVIFFLNPALYISELYLWYLMLPNT